MHIAIYVLGAFAPALAVRTPRSDGVARASLRSLRSLRFAGTSRQREKKREEAGPPAAPTVTA